MIQMRNYGDSRQTKFCAFCATFAINLTKDHTPSKVFLNKPYPENMHIVGSCHTCNNNFSIDEEYIAYWIEIALFKKTGIDTERYKKTIRALDRNLSLKKQIVGNSLFSNDDLLAVEENRLNNIMYKLASGHVLFKYNNPQYEKPSSINYFFLHSLNKKDRNIFEAEPPMDIFPEVGSRMMMSIDSLGFPYCSWEIVQEEIYRYLVANIGTLIIVKIVLNEFLGCEVIWDEERLPKC